MSRFGAVCLQKIDQTVNDSQPVNTKRSKASIWAQFACFVKKKKFVLEESTSKEELAICNSFADIESSGARAARDAKRRNLQANATKRKVSSSTLTTEALSKVVSIWDENTPEERSQCYATKDDSCQARKTGKQKVQSFPKLEQLEEHSYYKQSTCRTSYSNHCYLNPLKDKICG
ncbi:hypothetical protein ILUMI_06757 [Ignelater luminosus]|uniref:Uncharacterized protein n=1 Tax=Ignelater luminosus TaxID=2038154 RepID=A0A8K0D9B9_IGNLU|nr:hypothetical protein ILUMI_06757 [Ignelater luminosus]